MDSEFYPIIAAGVWQQYKKIKDRLYTHGNAETLYTPDEFGNTPFMYINLFSIEAREDEMRFPASKFEKDVIGDIMQVDGIVPATEYMKTLDAPDLDLLKAHYAKIKESFQINVLQTILESNQPHYTYEAYVRTDLFRHKIKSSFDIDA